MNFAGLQKLTLLDFPGKVACTVFINGCDMRCPFCHNSGLMDGSTPDLVSAEELMRFLEKRKGLLDGVCVTGGEPLLRTETETLLRQIKSMGYRTKLDTNGTHPERLQKILSEGLADYVAMDIKNSPEKYPETIGLKTFDLSPVRESVEILLHTSTEYEFRTTVIQQFHNEDSFLDIGAWLRGAKRYFLQPFVMRDTVPDPALTPPGKEKLKTFLEIMKTFIPDASVRGEEL